MTTLKLRRTKLRYFKVLRPSIHGWTGGWSDFDYTTYLPTRERPGKLLRYTGKAPLEMCHYGFHVTSIPQQYQAAQNRYRTFEVQVYGKILRERHYSNKICCQAIRLTREIVRPVLNAEWDQVTDPSFQRRNNASY